MTHIFQNMTNRYQRFRARRAEHGMKLLRLWVPNPTTPGFREEALRQAALLKGAPEESEALDFIVESADRDGWTA